MKIKTSETEKLQVYIPADLAVALRLRAKQENRTISGQVAQAIQQNVQAAPEQTGASK